MIQVERVVLTVRKAWWFWPVCAASILFPRLKALAMAGLRVEVI